MKKKVALAILIIACYGFSYIRKNKIEKFCCGNKKVSATSQEISHLNINEAIAFHPLMFVTFIHN